MFLAIIGVGIIGLVVADHYDFIGGRKNDEITIGNGVPDPLVSDTPTATATVPTEKPVIDGINKKPSCNKTKC